MFGGIGLGSDKEAQRIDRRRRDEEERKQRILQDPRALKMAVDTTSLEDQIRAKKDAKEAEKQREREEAEALRRNIAAMEALEAQKERERKEAAKAVLSYNKTQTELTQLRQDFPKTVAPAPLPEAGLSGLRTFQGEDVLQSERAKRQQQQLRDWSAQQQWEKEEKKRQEQDQERLYQQQTTQLDQTLFQLEQQQYQAKQAQLIADRDYNKQMAEQKRERDTQAKLAETFNNMEEIKYSNTSDLLTENPASQIRAGSPNRVIPYGFKGMTPEQIQGIRDDQARQVREKEEKKRREQDEKRRWDQAQQQQEALLAERERILADRQRDVMLRLQQENQDLARDQKGKNSQWNQVNKTNQPSDAYFSQFGSSAR